MNKEIKSKTSQEEKYINYLYDISNTADMINSSIIDKKFKIKLDNVFDTLNESEIANDKIEYEQVQSVDKIKHYLKTQGKVTDAFTNNAKTDRSLKKIYGGCLLFLLIIQLIAVNVIFVLGGLNILKYSDTTFNIFITGSLIEIAVIVRIVVKYLFTDNISKTFNNMMEQQIKSDNSKK